MSKGLPDFNNPPVVEVVLSVQFEPLEGFGTPQMGAFWTKLKDSYPNSEEHPTIDPVMESFGDSEEGNIAERLRIMLYSSAPVRHWYLNADKSGLIQIQKDRFIHNWRKTSNNGEYPRFENVLTSFREALGKFVVYLEGEKIGSVKPNQCEVTYVNLIPQGEGGGWNRYEEIGDILTLITPKNRGSFLPEIEQVRFGARFVIPDDQGKPIGRLYIDAEPGSTRPEVQSAIRLNMTARGRPTSENIDGIFGFFNIGHKWIVEGFAAVTSSKMHKIWGRADG